MHRSLAAACALALTVAVSGCTLTQSNDSGSGSTSTGPIKVTSSNSKCELTTSKIGSGNVVFKVKNTGSQVTEFYLYGKDGLSIVGEIENIGPGLSRDLVVRAQPGTYVTACKPGMKGQGIRDAFTVTDSGKDTSIKGVSQADIDTATSAYAAYVRDQSNQLVGATTDFVKAFTSGDTAKARSLYPTARQYYERIEPVAESFGDLDPKLDLRQTDLEKGQKWTGWHRLEKDLWPPASGYTAMTPAERTTYGDNLLANTKLLDTRVKTQKYSLDTIGNGAKGLLDEVAASKITGEEDTWSHTDLYDFQANVEGAQVAYEGLKPILEVKDKALSQQIGSAFTALQKLLDRYKSGDGFVFYDKVTPAQRKELSNAVNSLAEPLSKMTGAITL